MSEEYNYPDGKEPCPYCFNRYIRVNQHISKCPCSPNDVSPLAVTFIRYVRLNEENKKLKRELNLAKMTIDLANETINRLKTKHSPERKRRRIVLDLTDDED